MQNRSLVARLAALAGSAALVCAAASATPARAQEQPSQTSVRASFATGTKESTQINVLVGQSRVINFDRPIGRFSVSNPEVAEAVLVAPDQVLVNGKAFGQINLIAWEQKGGEFVVFDVFVRANLSLIDSQIRALFPKEDIRLSQANGSVVMSGSVANPKTATQAESVVQAAGFKTVNMLQTPVTAMAQVQLQVRVAEVSRSRLRELGGSFAYQASPGVGGTVGAGGGPFSVTKIDEGNIFGATIGSALNLFVMGGNTYNWVHALRTQGALRSLAEPNLIAMDGQEASFLAGGEYPVPVAQSGSDRTSVTIVFKEYGVRLKFKPTILDEDHIRLELEPEVSTIDFANGVKFEGFLIPALKTRRAKTGVELRDGQSFALAGLLDNNEIRSLSKIPVLGDIPILGTLFSSKSFQKSETELMFIVTAQLVKPSNRDDLPQWRGIDGLKNGSPLGVEPKGEGITGEHGFSTGGTTSAAPAQPKETTKDADVKTDAKADAKVDAKTDAKTEAKTEVKTEAKTEVKAGETKAATTTEATKEVSQVAPVPPSN
ncbi:MAG TPA: type II and III secretion system protein family protein [Pyrinomonadaceae bacterium]|nr:type II and III secretion system protein family protein [Pyrinomonadaceae bacterium]